MNGMKGEGASPPHPHSQPDALLLPDHRAARADGRERGGAGGWWGRGCDLSASRSGTDRDGFTVVQAWNWFSFPLELSWERRRLQTISK